MVQIEDTSFGTLLRRLRLAVGLTQEELAGRAGLSSAAISAMERGLRRRPYPYTVTQLMTALDLLPEQCAQFKALASRQPRQKTRAPFANGLKTRAMSQAQPKMALLPLIGRAHEKAWLQRELAGERPVVLLTGEPGIGKTHLLYETMDWAKRLGWQVLSGGCQRNSGQEPYAPLVEALQRSIRGLQPKRLRAGLQGCAWLARLLPELAQAYEGGEGVLASPDALPPDQEQRLMFAAIERYLSNCAGRAGTLLVLDDLQWASADTVHLLTRLVRSTGTRRIRLLGAYRSTDVAPGHRLSTLVADLAREDLVRQLELAPLAAEEATALASALLEAFPQVSANEESDVLVARIVEHAAGVPFFLVSYARWVQAQAQTLQCDVARRATGGNTHIHRAGLLGVDPADGGEIPWDVTQSIRERVAALPTSAQELLGAAAVVGRWAPGVLLAEAAAKSEVEALNGLEMACQVGLLVEEREERGPEGYRFAHDVIRDVVEASIGAWRQEMLHRRIAAALERGLHHSTGPIGSRQGEDRSLAQLAFHYMRADVPEKAAQYMRQAGDHARGVFAHREAAAYYRDLTQCLDRLGPCHEAAQARRDLAIELARVGCFGDAVASLEQAEQICRAVGDVEMLALVTVDIGNLRAAQGATEEGLARVQPLVAVLTNEATGNNRAEIPPVSPAVAAQLHGALSSLSFMVGRYHDALQTAERAVDVARTTGDGGLLAREQLVLGVALFTHGRLDEAIGQLEEAIVGADAVGNLEVLAEALRMASWTYQTRGAFAQSQAVQERALAVAGRLGDVVGLGHTLFLDALLAFYRGDWGRARAIAENSLEVFRGLSTSYLSSYPPLGLGWLSVIEGQLAAGEQYLAEAETLARQSGPDQVLRFIAELRAECELLAGEPEVANARLLPLFVGEPLQERTRLELMVLHAWATVQLGEQREAEEALKDCVGNARKCEMHLVLPDALRVQALWAMEQRSWQEAEDALDEALALCRAMPYPYAEAKVLYVLGLLHMETDEPEQARIHLEQALAICRRLGERLYGEAIEQRLAALPPGANA